MKLPESSVWINVQRTFAKDSILWEISNSLRGSCRRVYSRKQHCRTLRHRWRELHAPVIDTSLVFVYSSSLLCLFTVWTFDAIVVRYSHVHQWKYLWQIAVQVRVAGSWTWHCSDVEEASVVVELLRVNEVRECKQFVINRANCES